ncbi:hypothetical protein ACT4YZ_03410 [Acinetobacter baumannii]|uniref:hypothetical protein n=1 Tax=Acinetobacter TaxID=469 RepID=UPI0008105362|nr:MULTISPECIES: hypothetical protein [Acinetobacter]KAB0455576.1 hypothetical protein EG248_05320 [Acinetobacter baumannii]MCZ3341951.1 hypothetical protein [Acinetobacter baumannii]MDA3459761.1 hypothetical protein [Acinetobacter sp. AOR44_HL]MDC4397325.1 hypothetical protein [Acinetobacter baumannii]MDC5090613.1 hypothetical protein [Acinetobacter baumannii]
MFNEDEEKLAHENWYKNNDPIAYKFYRDLSPEFETDFYTSEIAWLARAKAQAVPTWILASTTLPEEGEDVLFLDTHNIIHEGCLNTDYADGPYGENGEDLGGNLTLWTSNSNGEEFLLEEVKFWMVRPSNPKIGESGAKQ